MKTKTKNGFAPGATVEEMLASGKSFAELLAAGDILDVPAAAARIGYSEGHVRRLCLEGKLSHFRRGNEHFFYPAAIAVDVIKHVPSSEQ